MSSGNNIGKVQSKEGGARGAMAGFCKFCRTRISPSLVIAAGPGIDATMVAKLEPAQREQLQLSLAVHEHLAAHHREQLGFILALKEAFANLLAMMTLDSDHAGLAESNHQVRERLINVITHGPQPAPAPTPIKPS